MHGNRRPRAGAAARPAPRIAVGTPKGQPAGARESAPASIDEYLATLDDDARRTLESVRASIRKAAPGAEETISYGFPAFRLNGKLLACFRGARAHCSYHPMSGRIVAANRAALSDYDTSAGTIRFPIGAPLPARIVRLLVNARIAEMDAAPAKKPAATRPASAKRLRR